MTTRQEYFNMMWNGLKSRGWIKSLHPAGYCAYRGMDNAKCAFGWVIPDEKYRLCFDGDADDGPIHIHIIMTELGMDLKDFDFFRAAQKAHDKAADGEDMEARFRLLADLFDLEVDDH